MRQEDVALNKAIGDDLDENLYTISDRVGIIRAYCLMKVMSGRKMAVVRFYDPDGNRIEFGTSM